MKERDNASPLLPLNAINERVSQALNISMVTVSRIDQSVKNDQPIPSPKKRKSRSKPVTDIDITTKADIRNTIYEMYQRKQHVTQRSLLEQLKEKDMEKRNVNILLVGETGVGKSTFINAFVNYLQFSSLDEATRAPQMTCLIPTQFTVSDENFVERVVRVENKGDDNETTVVGASSTQSSRSYMFTIDKLNVRLIDTPGIGDTRGMGKDEENFDNLLNVLGELEDIHAFCILLKPNNARLTVLFQYCVKQLLSRLDKGASKNIVFVFTNSRSTFYKPGDTLGPLREILKSIGQKPPHVQIPFGKDNVFCVDSEAFRFLAASREGIGFSEDEKKDFSISWEKSTDTALKLLQYVAGLKPHKIKDTISINEARRLILNLSEPLVLVAKNIDDNLRNIQKRKTELKDENRSMDDLQKDMHFDMIRLNVVEIDYPRTVCTDENCVTVYMIEGTKAVDYKQICHSQCYLKNVPQTVIGSPELKECAAMEDNTENPDCKECGHNYSLHMHIYVITEPYTSREIDKNIHNKIKKQEEIIRDANDIIAKMEACKNELEDEREIIQNSMAKFAHFLSNNAITPYNDKYQEYVQYLLDMERNSKYKDEKQIKAYEMAIDVHKQQVKILDIELAKARQQNQEAVLISANDIISTVQELYSLKVNGPTIKNYYDKQQKHRAQESLLHSEKRINIRWKDNMKSGLKKILSKMKIF